MTKTREQLAADRARPWAGFDTTFIECDYDPCADIEDALGKVSDGAFIVASMPKELSVMRRLRDGWVVVNEYLPDDMGSIVIVRKGEPKSKPMQFYFPYVWQIGDSYVLLPLVEILREKYPDVEIYFEYDVRAVIGDVKLITDDKAKQIPFDGIYHHDTAKSVFASYFRWNEHFYLSDVRTAGRMGWLPEDYEWSGRPRALATHPDDDEWVCSRLRRHKVTGEYVLVNPKAAFYIRDWKTDRFDRVIQFLDRSGLATVIVGKEKYKPHIRGYDYQNVVNLSGKTTLGQAYSLIKMARLMITPDTGLMHVACCMDVPTVAMFGPSVSSLVTLPPVKPVVRNDGGCIECYGDMVFHALCSGRADCMNAITTGQVLDAVAEELGIARQTEPQVSVCLMTLNERETLPDCLDSLRGLADEIVVVDTGSTDGTVEYLQGRDDVTKLIHETVPETGIEDFSYYRNVGFANATKKYVMWIDACERVRDAVAIKEQVVKGLSDGYYMMTHQPPISYSRLKIAPREFATFIDPIHEYIDAHGMKTSLIPEENGVERLNFKKVGREDSNTRNLRILRKLVESSSKDDPNRPRYLFYLARDLSESGQHEKAIEYFNERILMYGFWEERVAACVVLARIYLFKTHEYHKADAVANIIDQISDKHAESPFIKGEALYWRGEYEQARLWYEKCMKMPRPTHGIWLWEDVYSWLPYDRMSRIRENAGDIDGAIAYARQQYDRAPSWERSWIEERIKSLCGLSDFVGLAI